MKKIKKLIGIILLILIIVGFAGGYKGLNFDKLFTDLPEKILSGEFVEGAVNTVVNNLENINLEGLSDEELAALKDEFGNFLGNYITSEEEENITYTAEAGINDTVEGTLEVHYIDVGQGDCTLIKYDDQEILIDCAEDDNGTLIQNYLEKQGVDTIEYLVLTHFDSDHIGSADVIITKFDIENIFVTDFEKSNKTIGRMNEAIEYKGYTTTVPEVGYTFNLNDAVVEIVGPLDDYEDSNDSSLILKLTHGENSFLFMADAEEAPVTDLVASDIDIDVDVLKVGHHGSSTSTTQEFIAETSPEYAVISCGEGNSYGHPHAETLNYLRMAGVKLYRTDEQGSIVATSDGQKVIWNAAPTESWLSGR